MTASTLDTSLKAPPRPVGTRIPPKSTKNRVVLTLLPAVAFLAVFFLYPLANIVWLSFTDPSVGLGNYTDLLTDGISVTVLVRTLTTSALVALLTLLIAYPYAYAMTKVSAKTRGILTLLVLLPFWTSLMARNFAWYVLEQRGGPIDQFFSLLGIEGMVLLGSLAGVTIAMVQVMLPYMVLPLFTSLNGIDTRLMDAAMSCGVLVDRLPNGVPAVVAAGHGVRVLPGLHHVPRVLHHPRHPRITAAVPHLAANRHPRHRPARLRQRKRPGRGPASAGPAGPCRRRLCHHHEPTGAEECLSERSPPNGGSGGPSASGSWELPHCCSLLR
nr:ABC transporter permease [Arthrobacter sp. JZ12]